MSTVRIAATALLLLVLSACVTDESNENEGRPPAGDRYVLVQLNDDEMTLASEVTAGTVSFEIENNGAVDHAFAIEGPGVSERTDDLGPLDREVLTVNLEPGTYTVFSPVGDDRDNGLEATLEVIEPPASEVPEEQPGIGPSDAPDDIGDDGP